MESPRRDARPRPLYEMRWTVRICLFLLAAWIVFAVSPYVALYRLSRAVERRDAAAIGEAINFRAFRLSLTKQLLGEYLDRSTLSRDMKPLDKKLAAEAGATAADPLVAQLLTPAALIDLLDDGWPQELLAGPPEGRPLDLGFGGLRRAWRLYATSEARGFRTVIVSFPIDAAAQDRYRLQMRLSGLTWRLSAVDLPPALLQKLGERLPR